MADSFIPYLTVADAGAAIAFYQNAFGATEVYRIPMPRPDGSTAVGHAELTLGEARFMLSDEVPDSNVLAPRGSSPVCMHLSVHDVDPLFQRAVAAGATVLRPLEDQFHGDRGGKLQDPFGHVWYFATKKEDLSPEEIQRRAAALFGA